MLSLLPTLEPHKHTLISKTHLDLTIEYPFLSKINGPNLSRIGIDISPRKYGEYYLDPALLPLEHATIEQSHDSAGLGCEYSSNLGDLKQCNYRSNSVR